MFFCHRHHRILNDSKEKRKLTSAEFSPVHKTRHRTGWPYGFFANWEYGDVSVPEISSYPSSPICSDSSLCREEKRVTLSVLHANVLSRALNFYVIITTKLRRTEHKVVKSVIVVRRPTSVHSIHKYFTTNCTGIKLWFGNSHILCHLLFFSWSNYHIIFYFVGSYTYKLSRFLSGENRSFGSVLILFLGNESSCK